MDHDQRFKALLQTFLQDFLRLVLGEEDAMRFDCAGVEWLQQEIYPDPPQGQRLVIDIVGRVPVREAVDPQQARQPEPWLILLHAEVESEDSVAPLRKRIYDYRHELRRKYDLPVLSVGVYLAVGLDGLGWDSYVETYRNQEIVRFQFPYIGLPALEAFDYVHGDNLLGTALSVLMRVPPDREGELKAEALERVTTAEVPEGHRHLLAECIDAYLPLSEPQLSDFEQRLLTPRYGVAMKTGKTLRDLGREEGREQGLEAGREEGLRALVLEMIEEQFGLPSEGVRDRIAEMSVADLKALAKRLPLAASLQEVGFDDGART